MWSRDGTQGHDEQAPKAGIREGTRAGACCVRRVVWGAGHDADLARLRGSSAQPHAGGCDTNKKSPPGFLEGRRRALGETGSTKRPGAARIITAALASQPANALLFLELRQGDKTLARRVLPLLPEQEALFEAGDFEPLPGPDEALSVELRLQTDGDS